MPLLNTNSAEEETKDPQTKALKSKKRKLCQMTEEAIEDPRVPGVYIDSRFLNEQNILMEAIREQMSASNAANAMDLEERRVRREEEIDVKNRTIMTLDALTMAIKDLKVEPGNVERAEHMPRGIEEQSRER